jgi:hypothetical protein
MNVWQRTLIVAFALTAAAAAHADTVPPEWGGIWSIHIEGRDCTTNVLAFSTTVVDTLCPNAEFPVPAGGSEFSLTCTTNATATTFSTHCTGTIDVIPECTATYVSDLSGTLGGDTYTASGTITTTYTGACFGVSDTCQNVSTTATRIAPTPTSCQQSPVQEQSWGELKSHYR